MREFGRTYYTVRNVNVGSTDVISGMSENVVPCRTHFREDPNMIPMIPQP